MKLRKPIADTPDDLIIDHAFRHVAGMHVLKTFLETKNWGHSFGWGGYGCRGLYWQGDSKGIEWSMDKGTPNEIVRKISVKQILERALKWVVNEDTFKPGHQFKLF